VRLARKHALLPGSCFSDFKKIKKKGLEGTSMIRLSVSGVKSWIAVAALLFTFGNGLSASDGPKGNGPKPGEPTDPKARKSFDSAIEWQNKGYKEAALEDFRKANKQDGGHCSECMRRAYMLATAIGNFKEAEDISREWLAQAQNDLEKAGIHYRLAMALQQQGVNSKKDKCFDESCGEFKTALALDPQLAAVHYALGVSLAHLHQDDAARAEFKSFLQDDKDNPSVHERAARYVSRIELARAMMAPPFSVTTLDGQHLSLDSLAGKVVLIDFWATWCGPCREALPHMQRIVHKFEGQPLVVLSVSLDDNEGKWKDFVAKNGMTWMQYRDGGFDGRISKQFSVNAIPATFTIDADGVLEDQHVGDADIEGKLKKLVARAAEKANEKPAQVAVERSPAGAQ
jgi:thiol-disulfide isomerase/thioredoxin